MLKSAEVNESVLARMRGSGVGRLSAIVVASLLLCYAILLTARNVVTLVDLQADRVNGAVAQGQFEDYVAFYAAGEMVREGRGGEIYDVDALATTEHEIMGRDVGGTGALAFFNPPFVALFFAPLTLLPIASAGLLLMLLNVAMVAGAASVLYRQLNIRNLRLAFVFWLAVFSFESVFWLVAHNQLSMFLVLGFLGFYVFQREGKPGHSGLALSLLLVKPQAALLMFVVLIWKRQWTALAPFCGVAVVLACTSLFVSGLSVLWEYPRFLAQSTGWEGSRGIDTQGMYGWNGFFSTVMTYQSTEHLAATIIASLGTFCLIFYSFRGRWEASAVSFPFAVGAVALGSLLLNPHVYLQDTVLIALVLVLGFVGWRGQPSLTAVWAAVAVLAWFLVSRTMALQADSHLNLVTPLIAVMFLTLVGGRLKQDSMKAQSQPTSSLYAFPTSEGRMAS